MWRRNEVDPSQLSLWAKTRVLRRCQWDSDRSSAVSNRYWFILQSQRATHKRKQSMGCRKRQPSSLPFADAARPGEPVGVMVTKGGASPIFDSVMSNITGGPAYGREKWSGEVNRLLPVHRDDFLSSLSIHE